MVLLAFMICKLHYRRYRMDNFKVLGKRQIRRNIGKRVDALLADASNAKNDNLFEHLSFDFANSDFSE